MDATYPTHDDQQDEITGSSDIRLIALQQWLNNPPNNYSHPVLAFAAKRFFFDEGVLFDRVSFAAHAVLEGMPDTPVFSTPTIKWASVKNQAVVDHARDIAQCVPALPFTVSPSLDVNFAAPDFPSLYQRELAARLQGAALETINRWLVEQQCLFVEFLHTSILSIALLESEERWAALYLTDPTLFAAEMAASMHSSVRC